MGPIAVLMVDPVPDNCHNCHHLGLGILGQTARNCLMNIDFRAQNPGFYWPE
jgi:hypothetical protein